MAMLPSLSISMTGMKAAQAQLELVSRNISNVDTAGYTRKTAGQTSIVTAGHGYGVNLGDTVRTVDEGLLKSFLASNSTAASLGARYEYLGKTDILLGTPLGDNSIAASISSLQTSFENFANDVVSASSRYSLLSAASSLSNRLNSLSSEVQKLRGEADLAVSGAVKEVNMYLDEIEALNDDITKATILNSDGLPDLMDKRDTALRNLSGLIDIYYFSRENGEIVVQTTDGVMLLDKDPHYLSHNAISQSSSTVTYESGGISGIYVDGKDITKSIQNGEVKGLLDIRDVTLVSLQDQLDQLANVLKEQVNQVHNQGTAFPQTPSVLEGSRSFIDSSVQGIQIENGDVRFTIFDLDGNQVATTNLGGGLGFTSGTIDDMATALQNWLRSASPSGPALADATVAVDSVTGKLSINTQDSNYTISIVDEASSTPGSEQVNATINFDADGNGTYDRSFEGFSYFFGLNNLFTEDTTQESIYDSNVARTDVRIGGLTNSTLSFSTSSRGLNYASITVSPSDTLRDVVNKINSDPTLSQDIVASLVPNGSGYVLRIMTTNGEQLEITESAPGVISKFGLEPSASGLSASLKVREDMLVNPNLVAGGSPEFNNSTGKYELNAGRNNIANDMAAVFSNTQVFAQTGNLSTTTTTLANYASTFVGLVASEAANSEAALAYQAELTNSIATKEANLSAVDQDEELAQMILFQQSYAACAKSFTAAKEMLDMLLSLV